MADLIKVAYDKRVKTSIVKDTDVPDKFCWHIKFNDKLNVGTVRKSNIKIVDENGDTLKSRVKYIDDTLVIIPRERYQENTEYTLIIDTKVASESGKSFKKPLEISFTIEGDNIVRKPSDNAEHTEEGEATDSAAQTSRKSKLGASQKSKKKYVLPATYFDGTTAISGKIVLSASNFDFSSGSFNSKKANFNLPIREMSSADYSKGKSLLDDAMTVFMRNGKSYRFSVGQAKKVVDVLKNLINAYNKVR